MTRLDDCTPTPEEQARYATPAAEREAQIRRRATDYHIHIPEASGCGTEPCADRARPDSGAEMIHAYPVNTQRRS